MMKIHVNIATDRTDGFGYHIWSPPGIPFPIAALPTKEGDTAMDTGQSWNNKLTSNVKHKGNTIVLEGHDCGVFIQDITIGPPNNQYPSIWPNSFRKIAFAASTVKMNGAPTGCADISGVPPITMMTCSIVTSPVGLPRTNGANTVLVGMTGADFLAGFLGIMATMIADIIGLFLQLWSPSSRLLKAILGALGLVGGLSAVIKYLLGVVAGVAVSIKRWVDGGREGPIVITIPPPTSDLPPIIINYDPSTGKVTPGNPPQPVEQAAPRAQEMAGPSTEDWGHPLDAPDDRPGWDYNPEKGWVMP